MTLISDSNVPAGWAMCDVPEVDEECEGWFWAWVVDSMLDADGQIITESEPEIVLVVGAEEACDRNIYRAGRRGSWRYSDLQGLPRNRVLWKGPLHYNG